MNNRQDLPLKNDIAARFLPIIVGLMVYLGSLCCVFTFFVLDSSTSWKSQLTTHVTLELSASSSIESASLQARVLQLLNKTPGVEQVAAVPQKDLETLLNSLVGRGVALNLPSLPILIDISLNDDAPVDLANLEAHLKNISPQIQMINHRGWAGSSD